MKLKLQFGLAEPKREVDWNKSIREFPNLVLYKNVKWEFVMYDQDPSMRVDYICLFSEVKSYDPNWYSQYENIDYLLDGGWNKCECGAAYTSFPNGHMFMCKKWTKF